MQEIEVKEFPESGYRPLVDFESWRVAVLKYCADLKLENIRTMQYHAETDEAFILLQGQCSLFTGGVGPKIGELKKTGMELHKVYVIKRGVWHNHSMSRDGEVLIVENSQTSDENSPIMELSPEQQKCLHQIG